jgi:hypothetical protein
MMTSMVVRRTELLWNRQSLSLVDIRNRAVQAYSPKPRLVLSGVAKS